MDPRKQTEGFRGEGVGDWDRPVTGSKEGMYCNVHWMLYAINVSLNFTLETGDVLCGD